MTLVSVVADKSVSVLRGGRSGVSNDFIDCCSMLTSFIRRSDVLASFIKRMCEQRAVA